MKTATTLTICACALVSGLAYADTGKTTQQAQADLDRALQNGTVVTGYQGMTPRQVRPDLYPRASAVPRETRYQAQASLDQALQDGTVVTDFQGQTPRQLHPELYPPAPALADKSRAQVENELAAAMQTGNVAVDDQGMTPRQIAHGATATSSMN